jgi:hypothetical protein
MPDSPREQSPIVLKTFQIFSVFLPGGFSGCEWIVDDITRTKQIVSFASRPENAPP